VGPPPVRMQGFKAAVLAIISGNPTHATRKHRGRPTAAATAGKRSAQSRPRREMSRPCSLSRSASMR
jgi:hypothetical protein